MSATQKPMSDTQQGDSNAYPEKQPLDELQEEAQQGGHNQPQETEGAVEEKITMPQKAE